MVIGLTGGIGSGKTTVANIFASYKNVVVYFADAEAKKLMNTSKEIKQKLIAVFGENTFLEGKLNRQFIADIVFKDKEKLQVLNSIVHPLVKKHFKEFVEANSHKHYIIYENAILFESNSYTNCDKIITVFAPLDLRIQRVVKRDNTTKEKVLNRINNQWKEDKKLLLSNYIIENISLEIAKNQVHKIHNILTEKSI